MLSSRGRAARAVATLVVAAATVAGSAWGQDDHFPFGPFRMYSTTNDLNGTVTTIRFQARNEAGELVEPRAQDFGLRPAEVNGQVARLRADPELMGHLASVYERIHPDRPPLVEIELRYGLHQLENGRPVAYSEQEVATWVR